MRSKVDSHLPMTWSGNSVGLGMLVTTVALLAFGVVMVYSAVASVVEPGAWYARCDVRHAIFAAVAAGVLAVAWRFDYRRLAAGGRLKITATVLAAALVCGLLVYVPGVGRSVGGKFRWIRLGPVEYGVGFQPSELIKLSLVIFLAAWLSRETIDLKSFRRTFLPALLLVLLCAALVIREDFGTAALIIAGGLAAMLLAGVPWPYLLTILPPGALGFWVFVVRDPRRWARIIAMIDPWCPTNPSAYQARQSLLAVITGGYFGKGLGCGTLKRGYLPEGTTDFIFSVFCEEWGLVGALLLVGLVVVWIWKARQAALCSEDRFGRALAGSLGFLIGLQAVLHVAVDLVAAPPTGIGCPFVSAGGTRLVTMAIAAALIVSVTAHRSSRAAPAAAPSGSSGREPSASGRRH